MIEIYQMVQLCVEKQLVLGQSSKHYQPIKWSVHLKLGFSRPILGGLQGSKNQVQVQDYKVASVIQTKMRWLETKDRKLTPNAYSWAEY